MPLGFSRGELTRDWVALTSCFHLRLRNPLPSPLSSGTSGTSYCLCDYKRRVSGILGKWFSWRNLNCNSLYKGLFIPYHTEFNLEEACRLQIKHFILYIFIIFAMVYFSEHGKQDFSLNGEPKKIFFLAYKRPSPQSWLFFSFFLKFLCSVGFWALSALSSLHFGGDRRPLRLVSCKVGKAPLLIFLPHAQQVLLGWAYVSLLECLLVLGRQARLLFLEGERVGLQPFSRRVVTALKPPAVCSSPGAVSDLKAFQNTCRPRAPAFSAGVEVEPALRNNSPGFSPGFSMY